MSSGTTTSFKSWRARQPMWDVLHQTATLQPTFLQQRGEAVLEKGKRSLRASAPEVLPDSLPESLVPEEVPDRSEENSSSHAGDAELDGMTGRKSSPVSITTIRIRTK